MVRYGCAMNDHHIDHDLYVAHFSLFYIITRGFTAGYAYHALSGLTVTNNLGSAFDRRFQKRLIPYAAAIP